MRNLGCENMWIPSDSAGRADCDTENTAGNASVRKEKFIKIFEKFHLRHSGLIESNN